MVRDETQFGECTRLAGEGFSRQRQISFSVLQLEMGIASRAFLSAAADFTGCLGFEV